MHLLKTSQTAVILAAGKGSRLRPVTETIPKEMIPVGGRPMIEYVLDVIRAGGIRRIGIVINPQKTLLIQHLGSGSRFGVSIAYLVQEEPRGTAHALSIARDFVDDEFVLAYGDTFIKPATVLRPFLIHHREKNPPATILLHYIDDPTAGGVVYLDEEGMITRLIEKPTLAEAEPFRHNGRFLNIGGLMVLKTDIFEYLERLPPGKNGELWLTDGLGLMQKDNKRLYGYIHQGIRLDLGNFEAIAEAERIENHER